MFDIGFWELFLLFVLGLIVLGPERLPRVARTLGLWAGRARGYVRQLSNELDRELQTEELRRKFREADKAVKSSVQEIESLKTARAFRPDSESPEEEQKQNNNDKPPKDET